MMITVFGLGFVGLTTALGFCEKLGCRVWGVDVSKDRVEQINRGEVPFWEPHLEDQLKKHLNQSFRIADTAAEAIKNSEIIFICVGTPCDYDGAADLTYVFQSIDTIIKERNPDVYQTIIIKSTVPPGTCFEKVLPYIENQGLTVGKDIGLANNPEFLKEGSAWADFIQPDRIVIGTQEDKSYAAAKEIYVPFDAPIHEVSMNTAEFIKYASNTLLSTLISFSNELSMLADAIGHIDIPTAFKVLHEDQRWFGQPAGMKSYVYPGCGFGGYCLPKDTQALYTQGSKKGFEAEILPAVIAVNNKVKNFAIKKIIDTTSPEETIGILGLSFKPDSDDVRDSAAQTIIEGLILKGYTNIIAYDPMAIDIFQKHNGFNIRYAASLSEAVREADCLVLLTAWKEFMTNKELIQQKKFLDFRYCLG